MNALKWQEQCQRQSSGKHMKTFPKNLIHPLLILDSRAMGYGDLLSQLLMHIGARDEEDHNRATTTRDKT